MHTSPIAVELARQARTLARKTEALARAVGALPDSAPMPLLGHEAAAKLDDLADTLTAHASHDA